MTGGDPRYRPGVGVMLLNRAGCAFAAERVDTPGAWQMPQGGIDQGESPVEAAFRELKEEIGTAEAELLAEHPDWLTYDLPEALRAKVWGGRYLGQVQKWFAFGFLGADADIDLNTVHREFSSWRWVAIDDLPRLIVDFKRPLYEKVVAAFRPLADARRNAP